MLDLQAGNNLRIRGLGASAAAYQIEVASDLANPSWVPAGSSTADGNGRFTFLPGQPTNAKACFYRAVLPAPQQ
jgi:hypothetical protein